MAGVRSQGIDFHAISLEMGKAAGMWMNGEIEIINPNGERVTPYDPVSNTGGEETPTIKWRGKARIQQLSATRGANIGGQATQNPTLQRTVIFQIPAQIEDGYNERIERGWLIRVVDGAEAAYLSGYNFFVDSSINSSLAWLRTVICIIDVQANSGRDDSGDTPI